MYIILKFSAPVLSAKFKGTSRVLLLRYLNIFEEGLPSLCLKKDLPKRHYILSMR